MISKDTYICCDFCYEDFCPDLNHLNAGQIRQIAKTEGWKYIKGKDVCPKCQRSRKTEAMGRG